MVQLCSFMKYVLYTWRHIKYILKKKWNGEGSRHCHIFSCQKLSDSVICGSDVHLPAAPLPSKSPLKSALVDRRRSPSPANRRVAFAEVRMYQCRQHDFHFFLDGRVHIFISWTKTSEMGEWVYSYLNRNFSSWCARVDVLVFINFCFWDVGEHVFRSSLSVKMKETLGSIW